LPSPRCSGGLIARSLACGTRRSHH
jgi:hypothetical protein